MDFITPKVPQLEGILGGMQSRCHRPEAVEVV